MGGGGLAECLPGASLTKQPATLSMSPWLQPAVAPILLNRQGITSTTESILRKSLQHCPLPGQGTTASLWLWAAPGLQKTGMGDQWVLLPPRTSPVPLPPTGAVGKRHRRWLSTLPWGALPQEPGVTCGGMDPA